MSDRIRTRATMSSPARAVATRAIDEGERLAGEPVRLAAERIRAALLIGDWSGAVYAMLSARGGVVDAKGLEIEPNERGPMLSDIEADYVVALCECHLTRTDLVVGAQELCRLSRWTAELAEAARDRAEWTSGPRGGTAAMSMSVRRKLHHEIRISYLRSSKKGEVA